MTFPPPHSCHLLFCVTQILSCILAPIFRGTHATAKSVYFYAISFFAWDLFDCNPTLHPLQFKAHFRHNIWQWYMLAKCNICWLQQSATQCIATKCNTKCREQGLVVPRHWWLRSVSGSHPPIMLQLLQCTFNCSEYCRAEQRRHLIVGSNNAPMRLHSHTCQQGGRVGMLRWILHHITW